jgi:type VI secretion system secreted protein Hcp
VASAPLFSKCCMGEHLPEVTVVLRKAGGANPLEYLTYKFTEVYVDSIQWSGSSGGDDTPSESLSLTFAKVEITYKQQDEKGGAAKTIGASWDLRSVSK